MYCDEIEDASDFDDSKKEDECENEIQDDLKGCVNVPMEDFFFNKGNKLYVNYNW